MLNRSMAAAPCAVVLCLAQALPVHAETMSMQVYDDVVRLGMNGWMELPENPLQNCSRQQIADLVSGALSRMEGEKTAPIAEEYGRISRVVVMDEVQWKLAKEQENYALDWYNRAMSKAREGEAFQYALRDYLQSKMRTQIRRMILDADYRRQQMLLDSIPRDAQDLLRLQKEFLPSKKLLEKLPGAQRVSAAEMVSGAQAKCDRAVNKAKVSQEVLVRHSIQGDNHLEKMIPLKDRMEADQKEYQLAARDYAQAKVRAAWMQTVSGEVSSPKDSSQPAEKDGFFGETGDAVKIMKDAVRVQGGILRGHSESETVDGNSSELFSALAVYRSSLDQAEKSLSFLRSQSWNEASPTGNLLVLQEKAEHDLKDLQYASWAYARAWMKMQWAQHAHEGSTPIQKEGVLSVSEVMETFSRLRAEFLSRCFSSQYLDEEAASELLFSSEPVRDPMGKRFKIDAEVRLDYGYSSGKEGIGNRARLRTRLYPDFNFDNNWHLKGMVEYERTLSGKKGSEDGRVKLSRYYLEGNIGDLKTKAGVFGSYMAEGNIYDSKFKGVHLEAGSPVRYAVEYGSMDASKRAYNVTASYKGDGYRAEVGYYQFSKVRGATRRIYMGNFRKPLGPFDFGVMMLYGRDAKAGNGFGYVLSLSRGFDESWKKGNLAYWLKYYRQPSATYISHTMNGMADMMSSDAWPERGGFTGFGLGGNYTISSDISFALEYYRLRDLSTDLLSNTIWSALTGYFHEREE